MSRPPPRSNRPVTLCPYTVSFRSPSLAGLGRGLARTLGPDRHHRSAARGRARRRSRRRHGHTPAFPCRHRGFLMRTPISVGERGAALLTVLLLVRSEERRVGKSVSVRVDLGGRRIIKKKN